MTTILQQIQSRPVLKLDTKFPIQYCTQTDHYTGSVFTEENTLLFIKQGVLKFRYGKVDYAIGTNQVILLRKDIMIKFIEDVLPDSNNQLKFIAVLVKPGLVKEFVKLSELNFIHPEETGAITINPVGFHLSRYVESLEPYLMESENLTGYVTRIKLIELMYILARADQQIISQLLDLRQHFQCDITLTVEENILNTISLKQLAIACGRSLSSFRRDFLAIYNIPPSQWIRQRRLEKARELLSNTTMTVTDVCYTLGFESLPHFSRLFKSHFGHSPSGCKP